MTDAVYNALITLLSKASEQSIINHVVLTHSAPSRVRVAFDITLRPKGD